MLLVGERPGGASASKSVQSLRSSLHQKFRELAYNCKATDGGRQRIVHAVKIYWEQALICLALSLWMGIFHFNTIMICGALCFLPSPYAIAILVLYATLIFIPIRPDSSLGRRFALFIAKHAPPHFPLKVIVEDESAIDHSRAHIIALEPHSVLPISAIAFVEGSGLQPYTNVRVLASTSMRHVPVARHTLTWLGMDSVDKASFTRLLREGKSCVVVPGGVQECLYMNRHQEVLFLKRRKGFVRLAIKEGAPLVPVFCFGQRDTYHFWFPRQPWFYALSRKLRFAPLYFWGMFGGPWPYPRPMTLVFGKPIEVERIEEPSEEEVGIVHERFLDAMKGIYERHKVEAGAKDVELVFM